MPRLGRSYLIFELLAGLVTVAAAMRLPHPQISVLDTAYFLGAMFVLSLFDLWLPHGDNMDIAEALAIGALFVLGPVPAMATAVIARLAAHAFRHRFDRTEQLLQLLSRRVVSLGIGALAWVWLAGQPAIATWDFAAYLGAASVGVVVDAMLLQAFTATRQRQSMGRLFLGNLRLQGLMWGAFASVAVLTAVLYPEMGFWTLLLMVGLLVVMRQSFSLLLDIRQAYQSTMEALAAALEAHDPRRQGHAERVAALSRSIGIELGLHGQELERLGYAALLHDVDLIGTEDGMGEEIPASRASEVLGDVGFLKNVLPVLAVCDGRETALPRHATDTLLAYIVCRASNMDELITHERAAVRVYPPEFLKDMVSTEERDRVEHAVWHLLTPGARLSA